ncbi:NACHT domain-containing protein [Aeromonas dhakensis]|uniref:NACHT domain-containing protein n=1 Tax=Aeromonas dhakensis TaxID=196024 RepID=UPI002279FA13|nr:NACHT domain-containing protein [Aeromonas dhakensis]WAF75808.1 NACHT domain-containing protein [Aeromonas dhakensis]
MIEQIVLSETFKIIMKDVVERLKLKSSTYKRLSNINVHEAYMKATNVENVKTIWQVDRSVNLNEFYCPSRIRVEYKTICVDSLAVFPENSRVVIQGTAGQGKSILLRHLAGLTLKKGPVIPIFIELRKISERTPIETLLIGALSELGITIEVKDLDAILESERITILLDAFDEIPESCVKDTLFYIDSICSKYQKLQILVTSRPSAEIQKVSYFSVYNLEPLQATDFRPMLLKFFEGDESTVHQIMKALHENDGQIVNLIKTPLLLTLLAITYKTYHKIPAQLHEFYENIFHVLVNRHDATKPGFRREYKSGLNERQLEELFCAFCFYSMIEDKGSLSRQDAINVIRRATGFLGVMPISENSFISDCIKNTCLLLEEGFNYHFIHKSIREYHAAKFISISPMELKDKFYTMAMLSYHRYRVELDFLKIIDEHYFNKFFLLPVYHEIFNDLNIFNELRFVEFHEVLDNVEVSFSNDDFRVMKYITFGGNKVFNVDYMNEVCSGLISEMLKTVEGLAQEEIDSETLFLTDLIRRKGLEEKFNLVINSGLSIMFERYVTMKNKFERKEKIIADMRF